jgi:hypothetical protein
VTRPTPEDPRSTGPLHAGRSTRREDRYTFGDSDLAASRLRLRDAVEGAGVRVLHDARRDLRPPMMAMARLHAWNVRAWRHDPYAAAAFDPAELDELQARRDHMAERPVAGVEVRYTLGELVVEA